MGKITISGDSLREIVETIGALTAEIGGGYSDAAPAAETAERPKATRGSRKKAEAPDPISPTAPTEATAPGANPFTGAPAPEMTPPSFAPAPEMTPPSFAPAAEPAPLVDRPAVARLKGQLDKLSEAHGRAQVMAWALSTGFGLAPTVTAEEFLSKLIHTYPDDQLDHVYRIAGGK